MKAERPEDFEEFEEDFEEQDASYQVWILGYDADQNITDFSDRLLSSIDPQRAIDFAKRYVEEFLIETVHEYRAFPDNVKFIEVLVETISDVEGVETNVGTLFDEYLEI